MKTPASILRIPVHAVLGMLPVGIWTFAQFAEPARFDRALLDFPAFRPVIEDKAGLHLWLACKAREFVGTQRIAPLPPRIADETWLLLPRLAKKQRRIEAIELRHLGSVSLQWPISSIGMRRVSSLLD